MKYSLGVDKLIQKQITRYAEICGWTLTYTQAQSMV